MYFGFFENKPYLKDFSNSLSGLTEVAFCKSVNYERAKKLFHVLGLETEAAEHKFIRKSTRRPAPELHREVSPLCVFLKVRRCVFTGKSVHTLLLVYASTSNLRIHNPFYFVWNRDLSISYLWISLFIVIFGFVFNFS